MKWYKILVLLLQQRKGTNNHQRNQWEVCQNVKMLPNVNTVIIAEEGHSDLTNVQLMQSEQGM